MIEVTVLHSGIYNGPSHTPLPFARKGERITVASVQYAEGLVTAGFVRYTTVADLEQPVSDDVPVVQTVELLDIEPVAAPVPVVRGTRPQRGRKGV